MELTLEERQEIERQVMIEAPEQYREAELCKEKREKIARHRENVRKHLIEKLLKQKASMVKNIFGVNVEIDHPQIKAAKSVKDLEDMGLFSHLGHVERKAALAELFGYNNIKSKVKEEKGESQEKN